MTDKLEELLADENIKFKHKKRVVFIFESVVKFGLLDHNLKNKMFAFAFGVFVKDQDVGLKCRMYHLFCTAGFEASLDTFFSQMDSDEVSRIKEYSKNLPK